ncbi:hypothetical protein [Thermofilum sp.]|uniref:hypothetical protein n=1 Tax=Thermofilum sp. TaxID=1961369 RepID=UPI00316820A6
MYKIATSREVLARSKPEVHASENMHLALLGLDGHGELLGAFISEAVLHELGTLANHVATVYLASITVICVLVGLK